MSRIEYEIKTLPAYRAMGIKCDVAFTEIEAIKEGIQQSIKRAKELEYAINTDMRLGLSYHLRPDGFVYYSAFEVQQEQPLLEGMAEVTVPEMTYLVTKHKGSSIEDTYGKIIEWLKESEYVLLTEQGVEYYDELPIKHEKYPSDSDASNPHFEIFIPIVRSRMI